MEGFAGRLPIVDIVVEGTGGSRCFDSGFGAPPIFATTTSLVGVVAQRMARERRAGDFQPEE